jgi:hypothetical protein
MRFGIYESAVLGHIRMIMVVEADTAREAFIRFGSFRRGNGPTNAQWVHWKFLGKPCCSIFAAPEQAGWGIGHIQQWNEKPLYEGGCGIWFQRDGGYPPAFEPMHWHELEREVTLLVAPVQAREESGK